MLQIKREIEKRGIKNWKKVFSNLLDENPGVNEIENQLDLGIAEHEEFIKEKAKGAQIRSKVRWYEEREKSTKYFLNLEKKKL